MAKQVEEFAKGTGLKVQVLSGSQLKDFGGLRAVGGSSPKPGPRMIQISYTPKRAVKSVRLLPHVVLVGKGITFDTGGISIKPINESPYLMYVLLHFGDHMDIN
jgi:leucyl aminopeptidase